VKNSQKDLKYQTIHSIHLISAIFRLYPPTFFEFLGLGFSSCFVYTEGIKIPRISAIFSTSVQRLPMHIYKPAILCFEKLRNMECIETNICMSSQKTKCQ
jgi:hypothetical protein